MEETILIIRKNNKTNYTTISNEILQSGKLSLEAVGVLCYLLSKPSDWIVMVNDIARNGNCSHVRTRRILNELKDKGYIQEDAKLDKHGRVYKRSIKVYEEPQGANNA